MKLSTIFFAAVGMIASVEGTAALRRASALAEDHEQAVLDAGVDVEFRPFEACKTEGDKCNTCAKPDRKLGVCHSPASGGMVCKSADGKTESKQFGYEKCAKVGLGCKYCDVASSGTCAWKKAGGAKPAHWKCVLPSAASAASAAAPAPPRPATK